MIGNCAFIENGQYHWNNSRQVPYDTERGTHGILPRTRSHLLKVFKEQCVGRFSFTKRRIVESSIPIQNMMRPALAIALIICNLLAISTGVGARCEACPNCDTESCLDNWTCSGDTITCNYPSAADPGTFIGCSYLSICHIQSLGGEKRFLVK